MEFVDLNQTRWWSMQGESRGMDGDTWVYSLLASCTVGLTGVVPLVIVPDVSKDVGSERLFRLLLSFAVGSLLGDVFLHLLPEAWQNMQPSSTLCNSHLMMGGWVLLGMITFIVVEKMFTFSKLGENNNCEVSDCKQIVNTGRKELTFESAPLVKKPFESSPKRIAGYLNLLANAIDNFTHGLAVAASFIVGPKMGFLTTSAILIHEIPHELGDFAILLKSGFNRWEAAKAQILTAGIGVAGAVFALSVKCAEDIGRRTNWILPFAAGGFLNIALINILPELMKEEDPLESLKQILAICLGIAVMAVVGLITE